MTDKQLMVPDMEKSKALELVSRMDLLLDQAEDWDAMLNVRNGAMGIAVLAGAKGMEEVAQRAKIVQLKAERKAGGWLAEQPQFGHYGGDRVSSRTVGLATYDSLGIEHTSAQRWQKMAKVSDRQFLRWIDGCLKDDEEITRSAFLRFIKPAGPAPEPEKPLTPLDKIVKAIQDASAALHGIGTTTNPGQYKRALAWAKQAESAIAELHRGATKLVHDLEKDVEGTK